MTIRVEVDMASTKFDLTWGRIMDAATEVVEKMGWQDATVSVYFDAGKFVIEVKERDVEVHG